MKIGLIREYKQPADRRVALSPSHCKSLLQQFPDLEILVEPSPDRAFKEDEYESVGAHISEDLSACDILLGVKEVPVDKLIPEKTYMFFSHTIKAQEYNRKLLQTIIQKKIRLIDYETLTWDNGGRILGFGKWAGVVGTYNAFLTWGKKSGQYELPPAHTQNGLEACKEQLSALDPGNIKIAFTGAGRVSTGIRDVLEFMKIKELSPQEFLDQKIPAESVFVQLDNPDLFQRKDGQEWNLEHFYNNHRSYLGRFQPYLSTTDVLINGMYWESDMPPLFRKADTQSPDFRVQVIADITCDVEGSVPITMEATDIYNPTFGWSRSQQRQVEAFGDDTIDVMAVTNLPTELPRNSSEEFGSSLVEDVLPLLINSQDSDIISRATITEEGGLTEQYTYLQSFVEG